MSFQAYVYVEDWSVVDRPMALLVQLQMANRADKNTGVIEVGHRELAEDCRFRSASAVERHIRYLVAIGEVEVLEPGSRGRGKRAKYRFPRMAAPPTAADRAAAAKRPPPRAFSDATTQSGGNGKDLPEGLSAGEGASGKDLEKTSESPPGRDFAHPPMEKAPSLSPSGTGGAFTHPGSVGEGPDQPDGKEAKPPAARRRPRVLRSPDDPVVRRRITQIRTRDGAQAAAAYRRTVEEAWNRKQAGDLLAERLGEGIGDMP